MSSHLGQWHITATQYNFKIDYRRSVDYGNADALTPLPVGLDALLQDSSQQETEIKIKDHVANLDQQVI